MFGIADGELDPNVGGKQDGKNTELSTLAAKRANSKQMFLAVLTSNSINNGTLAMYCAK